MTAADGARERGRNAMGSSTYRIAALALGLLLGAATATRAVIIYFKDGSQEVIADAYRIEGDKVIATLQSGQETAIPLAAVDLEKTEAMGKRTKGSAMVLDQTNPNPPAEAPPPSDRSLRDLMREKADIKPPAPAKDAAQSAQRRTPAGNIDLMTVPRRPVQPAARAEAIDALIRRQGLHNTEAFQGTAGNRVLLDVVTPSRGDVFSALEKCAALLVELRATMPEIDALELSMATSTRSRAGQFVLTPEEAQRLQAGATTPAEHFLANVLF
jgi:hypothetical protein